MRTPIVRVDIDGVALAYTVAGAGEPVICIHGAFIADTFQPLLAELSLAGRYQVITYHRRGYGESSRRAGPTSIGCQAADGRALLAHVGVSRTHVVGHSFGGNTALQLALDTPAVVASLKPQIPLPVPGPAPVRPPLCRPFTARLIFGA